MLKPGGWLLYLALSVFLNLAGAAFCPSDAAGKSASGKNSLSKKDPTEKNSGWILDANSNFAGTINCRFCEDAAQIHLDKMGLTMLARGPSWDVILYNEVNKSYLTMTYTKWQKRFQTTIFRRSPNNPFVDLPLEISRHSEKILGYPTDKYILRRRSSLTGKIAKTECWVANDVKVPEHFCGILHTLFSTPENIKGMPMRVEIPTNGRQVPAIEVYKLSPKIFGKDDFKPIPGYKKVTDELALMLDDDDDMTSSILGPDPSNKKLK